MTTLNCVTMLTEQEMQTVNGGAWLGWALRLLRDELVVEGVKWFANNTDKIMKADQENVFRQINSGEPGTFNCD